MVVFIFNGKIFQDQQDDKDIVNGQGIFSKISGEVLYEESRPSSRFM